jgi:hypothetical protein
MLQDLNAWERVEIYGYSIRCTPKSSNIHSITLAVIIPWKVKENWKMDCLKGKTWRK